MEPEIECGFNSNDETINFGSRGIADNESYEAVTLATVKFENTSPMVNVQIGNGLVFYSIDKFFGIFQDKECSSVLFSCTFECVVDVIFVYPENSAFVYIFLRDGKIQILMNDGNKYFLVNTCQLIENNEKETKLYINAYDEHFKQNEKSTESHLIVISNQGLIYRLSVIQSFEDSTPEMSHNIIFDIKSPIYVSAYSNSLLFLKSSKMWVLDVTNTKNNISCHTLDIKSASFLDLQILALLNSGEFVYICPFTLLYFPVEIDFAVNTFSLLLNEKGIMKHIVAKSEKHESEESYLYMLNSDFSTVFRLKVSNDILLINPQSVTEEILYISYMKNKELHFQCIHETDPEKRLYRLFRRKMFDEAERYAKAHNIDVSIVNMERAKVLVEKLKCTSEDIDQLIDILNCLEDQTFILDCCNTVESSCSNAGDVLRILKYGCDLKVKKEDTSAKEKQFSCKALFVRFNLFLTIGYDMEKWCEFSTCNLIDELKNLLLHQEIPKAIALYSCLDVATLNNLEENTIRQLLNLLNMADVDIAMPFLATFLPLTLSSLPTVLHVLLSWLETKVFEMEKQNVNNFPENAIDFLETTGKHLVIRRGDSYDIINDSKVEPICGNIKKMLKSLYSLQVLKFEYGVKIALNEFMQDPKIVVKILLNLELPLIVYNQVLQKFTYEYIVENGLNPDVLFLDALLDILDCHESYWTNIVGSILNCISSMEIKIQAVENILNKAQVPWNSTIRQLAKNTMKNYHPLLSRIQSLMDKEARRIVQTRKEYNISDYECQSIDELHFIIGRIISCNLSTMISDAFEVCGQREPFEIQAMRLLFIHFVEIGDFNNAFEVLEGSSNNVLKNCLELILKYISVITDISLAEKYIFILSAPFLTEKYNSLTENEIEKNNWENALKRLKNIYNLRSKFDVFVCSDLFQIENMNVFINEIIRKKVNDYEDGCITVSELLDACHHLSEYCGICREKLLLQCCKMIEVNKIEVLSKIAEDFLCRSNRVKYLSVFAVYLLQNLNTTCDYEAVENSFIDYQNCTVAFNRTCGKALRFAVELITKAVMLADDNDLIASLRLVPWVESIYFFKRYKKENEKTMMFENSFDIENFNPSYGTLFAIQKVFTMYTSFIAQYQNEEYKFLMYHNRDKDPISQEDFLNEINDVSRYMNALNQDGESLITYKLLITLQNQLKAHENLNVNIHDILDQIIKKQCIPNVLQSSTLSGDINENLLKNSLLWCDTKETQKCIEQVLILHKACPQKVAQIAAIGVKVFEHHKNMNLINYCQQLLLTVKWWEKLKHLNIDYNSFFKRKNKDRLELLVGVENFECKYIIQYCTAYNLENVQYFHLLYLKKLLINWKPKYEILVKDTGKRTLLMEKNQEQKLNEKCMEIMNLIHEKNEIENLLKDIWSKINFYHYEVFTCIIDICGHKCKYSNLILTFLKGYERISVPSETEKEEWFNNFPESQNIDPLSEFRMLYNSSLWNSKDIWNVIRKEISLKNYTIWFKAVKISGYLSIDDICSFLVKELVAQGALSAIKPGDWLYPKYTDFFIDIDTCLQHMKTDDMKKFTAAYWLLSNTPEGADQVTIAKITYKYAQEYRSHFPNSDISFAKIEKKYQRCLSLQILHLNQLADPKYTSLVLNIDQLLFALYHDDRILKHTEYINFQCPDINKAVDQLAEVYDLNVNTFRKKLITSFLAESGVTSFDDSSDLKSIHKEVTADSKHTLRRAAYICQSDVAFWREQLLAEGYDTKDSNCLNYYYRSRCLKCLMVISDVEVIESVTGKDFQSFVKLTEELILTSILSKFGMQTDSRNKINWKIVMKKLAQIRTPDSIRSLAEICKILKISKVKYWEYIISSANIFDMFSDLKEYLDYTKSEQYRFENFYINAWQRLIDNTVDVTFKTNDSEVQEKLIMNLFMIQQCPVLFFINVENSLKKYIQNKKFGAAIILVQYIPQDKRHEIVNNIKNNISSEEILKILDSFEAYGVSTALVRNIYSKF